jgi:hypothetical protein
VLQFIHGKVFVQAGKVLRPAKVVFVSENKSDSIGRLSAKSKPKRRNRRRTASQSEAAGSSKDNSPAKPVNMNHSPDARSEAIENGGAVNQTSRSNVKTSSPKYARTAKFKPSLTTHKVREKSNAVKVIGASKTFSIEDKDSVDNAEEPKQTGSAYSDRLDCNKEVAFTTQPKVLLHNITSDVNSSTLSVTVPNISSKNSDSAESPVLHDSTFADVSDPLPVSSISNAEFPDAGCASAMDRPNTVSPADSARGMTSPEIVLDEGTVLTPDTPSVDSSVKYTNTPTHVIHGTEDAECESMDTNWSLDNVGLTGETCDSASHEVGCVSEDVKDDLECKEVAVCDTAVVDVIMSDHEDKVSSCGSEMIREVGPAGSHPTHSLSDSPSGSWTREEDKTILQMFELDCGMAPTFCKFRERLPLRTLDEVSVD